MKEFEVVERKAVSATAAAAAAATLQLSLRCLLVIFNENFTNENCCNELAALSLSQHTILYRYIFAILM